MTKDEHELMLMMFARMQQQIHTLAEILKSREIATADDLNAFSHAAHYDEKKLRSAVRQVRQDYAQCALMLGITLNPTDKHKKGHSQ